MSAKRAACRPTWWPADAPAHTPAPAPAPATTERPAWWAQASPPNATAATLRDLEARLGVLPDRAAFERDGFVVLRGFCSGAECEGMMQSMGALVDAWAPAELSVFRTDGGQQKAQGSDDYFMSSGDKVRFFLEQGAVDGESGGLRKGLPKARALNKVGHALHSEVPAFRDYSQSAKLRGAVRALGWKEPALVQSMYIFKQPRIGGEVTPHQDSAFLRTEPLSCLGCWLALQPATEANGCLWARPGSHREPLRRRFVRSVGAGGEVAMTFVDAPAAADESYLATHLLAGPPPPPPPRLYALWAAVRRRLGLGAARRTRRRRVARSEAARAWEGLYPRTNTTSDAAAAAELAARGFVPLPVRAGDLVLFPGTLDHLSLPNLSPHDRHTFQLCAAGHLKAEGTHPASHAASPARARPRASSPHVRCVRTGIRAGTWSRGRARARAGRRRTGCSTREATRAAPSSRGS